MNNVNINLGIYQHYKNKYYEVLDIAYHSETLEKMVVYRKLYEDFSLWVRPLTMFLEQVEVDGKIVPRFKFISTENVHSFLQKT